MKIAWFDPFSGASGNMILGALLDAGLDRSALEHGLRRLGLGPWEMRVHPVLKRSVGALYVEFLVRGESADHATTVPPGPPHHHHHPPHHHPHHPPHHHEHHPPHHHEHHPPPPEHRGPGSLGQILERIRRSGLPAEVVARSCEAFRRLAEAEARVHRTAPEDVHFHEVGAVDALLDVVGTVLGLHLLGVEEVYSAPLPHGHGFVRAAHGMLPLPAPATAFLVTGVPNRFVDVPGELVTPTGAALLTTLARFAPPPVFVPAAVGHGAGRSDYPHPNLLRVFLGETSEPGPRPTFAETGADDAVSLEVNLDDMSPQLLGALMERLLAEGALDVAFAPLQMKKNRPGVQVQVLAPPELAPRMADLLLAETSTLGVRWHGVRRRVLERREITVETRYGPIRVKVAGEGGQEHRQPEFDDCRRAAEEHGVPVRRVLEVAVAAAQEG